MQFLPPEARVLQSPWRCAAHGTILVPAPLPLVHPWGCQYPHRGLCSLGTLPASPAQPCSACDAPAPTRSQLRGHCQWAGWQAWASGGDPWSLGNAWVSTWACSLSFPCWLGTMAVKVRLEPYQPGKLRHRAVLVSVWGHSHFRPRDFKVTLAVILESGCSISQGGVQGLTSACLSQAQRIQAS